MLRGATLRGSCSGDRTELPDVRAMNPLSHGWLLIDEGTPTMALSHKCLFQGNSGCCPVSTSSTNCYAQPVASWGARIVICCNDWHDRSAVLSASDREWLRANSIVVDVDRPLF